MIEPLAVWQGVLFITTEDTVIVIPAQGLGAVNVNKAEPVQPFRSFATIVKVPWPRLLKLPVAWKAPPFILNVNPVLPAADAEMLPLVAAADVGLTVVAVTLMIIPAGQFISTGRLNYIAKIL